MLSTKGKRFGLRAALGALALGIGLAGASVATAPNAEAYGWHHGWHGYGGGWHGPRVILGWGGYYPGYHHGWRARYYYPPAYVPYGGFGVVIR